MNGTPTPRRQAIPLRFGPFELDAGEGTLRRDGVVVALQELPLRLLAELARRPGEVVRREDLVRALWGVTHVDADAGLNTAVRKLREALGDSAESPRFLETVRRRGYRLLAPVERTEGPPAVDAGVRSADRPRRRWVLGLAAATAGGALLGALVAAHRPRLAVSGSGGEPVERARLLVLPLGAAASDLPLATALGDDLIAQLARLEPTRIEVIGPVSARRLGDRIGRGEELPRDLAVTHLLTGRIERHDDALSATLHLARAGDGVALWSDLVPSGTPGASAPLPRAVEHVVTRAARGVAAALGATAPRTAARAGTLSTAAYDAFLTAHAAWMRYEVSGFEAARTEYQRALGIDPAFAEAEAGLAEAEAMLALFGAVPPRAGFARAAERARGAITRAPEYAAAHAALGLATFYGGGEPSVARAAFERALALAPGRALTHQWLAGLEAASGRSERSLAAARRAAELEPLSFSVVSDLGWYFYFARRFDEAATQAKRAMALGHGPGPALVAQLVARATGATASETRATFELARRTGTTPETITALERAAAASLDALRRAEFESLDRDGGRSLDYRRAALAAALGEATLARSILAAAESDGPAWLPFARIDPAFDSLREGGG